MLNFTLPASWWQQAKTTHPWPPADARSSETNATTFKKKAYEIFSGML